MPKTSWPGLGNDSQNGAPQTAGGTALASSVTETIISQSPDINFAPNQLYAGAILHVAARGKYSTTGTPTLQIRLRYGGLTGVVLLDTTAITTISAGANATWQVDGYITIQSEGASGTAMAIGQAAGLTSATSFAQLPATGAAAVTIDTTAQKALVLTGQWGTSSASNSVQCLQFVLELWNA